VYGKINKGKDMTEELESIVVIAILFCFLLLGVVAFIRGMR